MRNSHSYRYTKGEHSHYTTIKERGIGTPIYLDVCVCMFIYEQLWKIDLYRYMERDLEILHLYEIMKVHIYLVVDVDRLKYLSK